MPLGGAVVAPVMMDALAQKVLENERLRRGSSYARPIERYAFRDRRKPRQKQPGYQPGKDDFSGMKLIVGAKVIRKLPADVAAECDKAIG
jgi:hypothetical protein